MNVLFTTDGSGDATVAMETARRLLRKDGLHVDVLSVIPEYAAVRDVNAAFVGHRRLVRHGLSAAVMVDAGSPAEEILQIAPNYDLVVVGAHGRAERPQPGLGPVSRKVVEHCRRSVLVGRHLPDEEVHRVLVCIDGSEVSFAALRAVERYLNAANLEVTLIHVVETPTSDNSDRSEYQRELLNDQRIFAQAVMERAERLVEQWRIPATSVVVEGDPSLELASEAERGDYDLIVAGATGNSESRHAVLGSVSTTLAWDAPCSVLVVRTA
jgi:nucleotide-binding universal stress UspA family protein